MLIALVPNIEIEDDPMSIVSLCFRDYLSSGIAMARLDFKLVFLFRDKGLSAASRDYFHAHARACANEEKEEEDSDQRSLSRD